jgi:hypothetical protein
MGHRVGELHWKDPDFLGISCFSVSVMEKCCDACGEGEYYYRSEFSTLQNESVSGASRAVDRKSMGHTDGELALRSWKSVVTLAMTWEYYFRSGFLILQGDGV